MSTDFTFVVEKKCPVCGRAARVVKVKSRLVAVQVDNDYCCHYRDFNPYLYHIWVCEHCSFAADEKVFLTPLPPARQELVADALLAKHVHFGFSEERNVPDGIASLKLAIYCAELLRAPIARRAGLMMRLAWIYRINGDKELEREFLEKTLKLYERSLETERYPIESLTDNMVMYLIGALCADLGDNKKAVIYLSKLVGSKNAPAGNDKISRDARRLWQEVREREQESLPDTEQHKPEPRAQSSRKTTAKKTAASAKKKNGFGRWFS